MNMYQNEVKDSKIISEILIDDFGQEKFLVKTLKKLFKNNVWVIINYNDCLHPDELLKRHINLLVNNNWEYTGIFSEKHYLLIIWG